MMFLVLLCIIILSVSEFRVVSLSISMYNWIPSGMFTLKQRHVDSSTDQ